MAVVCAEKTTFGSWDGVGLFALLAMRRSRRKELRHVAVARSWVSAPEVAGTVLLALFGMLLPLNLVAAELRIFSHRLDSMPHLPLPSPRLEGTQLFQTASRVPQRNGDEFAHNRLLNEEDFEGLSMGGLSRPLAQLPAVVPVSGGYLGQPVRLACGGLRPLVLLNGVPLAPGGLGETDLSSLSRISLARIEVVRDGLSSLYGSGAGAGVVNFLGKAFAGGRPFTKAGVARGAYDSQVTEVEFSRGIGEKVGLLLAWDWHKTDGHRANSDADVKCLTGDIRCSPKDGLNIGVRGERIESSRGLPGPAESPLSQRSAGVEQRAIFEIEEGNRKVSVYGQEASVDLENPATYESSRVVGLSAVSKLRVWEHLVVVGVDAEEESFSQALWGSHRGARVGLFTQGQIDLHPLVVLLPNLRYDLPSHQVSPKVTLAYRPSLGLRFFSSLGRSFRSPTLKELYLNPSFEFCDSLGNPDLEDETLLHSALGCAYRGKRFSVAGSLFFNSLEMRIGWDHAEPDWRVKNHDTSHLRGFELSFEKEASCGLSTGAGVFYQDVAGFPLPLSPEVRSNIWAVYRKLVAQGDVDMSVKLTGEYVSERWSDGERLDPYLLFNVRGELRLVDVSLFYQLDNVLAEDYELLFGYPMPERTTSFGFTWEFWD